MATATRIEHRLELHWLPTFEPQFPFEVIATEQVSSKRSTTVRYRVEQESHENGVRTFLIAKSPDQTGVARADEIYKVVIGPAGESCNCKGSACRRNGIKCRHKILCSFLVSQGVL